MTDATDWSQFINWAQTIAAVVDLDAEERDYKIVVAGAVDEARLALLADDPKWPELLRSALQKGNLLNSFFMMSLVEDLRDRPAEMRDVLLTLWGGPPDPGNLDAFAATLRPLNPKYAMGNALALGSVLLMALSPSEFPPFRTKSAVKLQNLVGLTPPPSSAPASAKYQALLGFLDGFIEACDMSGLPIRDRLDAQGLAWQMTQMAPPEDLDNEQASALLHWRGDDLPRTSAAAAASAALDDEPRTESTSLNQDISRGKGPSPDLEDAGWQVLGRGLRGEGSAFDPSQVTWTEPNAKELLKRVQENPDFSGGSFLEKLKVQLADAPREIVLLAAELLFLHVLPLANVGPQAKHNRIGTVVSWPAKPVALPDELNDALDLPGVFSGGIGFNTHIWRQFCWLCRFVAHWARQTEDIKGRALADPWAFRDVIADTPEDSQGIRSSIQYLAWPGYFEAIVRREDRRAIYQAFAHVVDGPPVKDDRSIDLGLHKIRASLTESDGWFDWYHQPYVGQWRADVGQGRRAWLIRPLQTSVQLIEKWRDLEIVSLRAAHLGEVPPGSDRAAIRVAVDSGYQHLDYSQRLALISEYEIFLTRIQSDDIVVANVEGLLHVGVVTGDAEYATDEQTRLRRTVSWAAEPVPLSALPGSVESLLGQEGMVVDLTSARDLFVPYLHFVEPDAELSDAPAGESKTIVGAPQLPPATDQLAREVHIDRAHLQEYLDLLQSRHQIVLFGPPGTGKSFLAQALADHIVGSEDSSRAQLVQFHPSTSYEDFFEGFRPTSTTSGQPTFEIQPGPLRRLASKALTAENANAPFVLIIDEMNRANLAKVFGELYFLLEYRDKRVPLLYNPAEPFRLPENLFIIGTMNTADRSIAMIDAAIRRRFPFVELHPDEPPVRDVLKNFLTATNQDDRRHHLLTALNAAFDEGDRDLQIGPSYLMRREAETTEGLERIWKYDILPVIDDHYFGRKTRQAVRRQFGLAVLLKKIEALTSPSPLLVDDAGEA